MIKVNETYNKHIFYMHIVLTREILQKIKVGFTDIRCKKHYVKFVLYSFINISIMRQHNSQIQFAPN